MQYAVRRRGLPAAASFARWARSAGPLGGEVTVRIVGAAEGRRLNRIHRGKDRPTNVLAFGYGAGGGDIALCHPVVAREAREQRKTLAAHYAHLVIHAMLHLRGFDHATKAGAARMERAEIALLARLGLADPYAVKSPPGASVRR